jgi:Zn-dependent M16 (insulinase) family peptidase
MLKFSTYRDPHVARSLEVFNNSVNWLRQGSWTQQDLEEAKLRTLADMDTPVAPSERGESTFSLGLTNEMRQKLVNRASGVVVLF